jgi:NADH dehydrogenase [ubiquinone] 1 alpha subcomplex assembly factor 7
MPPAEPDGKLKSRIVDEIRAKGPISIARFFEIAVADPQHGYWQRRSIIGASGDFVTAPEISQIFGELVGLWCAGAWQSMGMPAAVRLVELGPGRGTLMRDVLRTLRRALPAMHAGLHVHLVELSAPFRAAQAALLAGYTAGSEPTWHDDLASVPAGPAILVANEFLDALPVRQLVRNQGRWHERVVTCDGDGRLAFGIGDPVAADALGPAEDGAIAELRDAEAPLLATLAARTEPTAAIFIDYGPEEACFGDTLQAMRRHAYEDPLVAPGTCDLTAHVQFARFAEKARAAGFAVDGPMVQAEFLGAMGIAIRASRLMSANPGEAAAIELAAQRLIAPTGMGSLFKVLALRSPALPPAPPFA